ncbi:hypothetical protein ATSB10_02190 [Dyella thiooxydans]|uniref:Uncharacterized protein n=1 Tax=Dyella thiooxydans TaxID=445710 RepID=A0A160MWT6_9GAMM|nr:hypothetical protein ATSB10_02190 [Dyella thiooxydans]
MRSGASWMKQVRAFRAAVDARRMSGKLLKSLIFPCATGGP